METIRLKPFLFILTSMLPVALNAQSDLEGTWYGFALEFETSLSGSSGFAGGFGSSFTIDGSGQLSGNDLFDVGGGLDSYSGIATLDGGIAILENQSGDDEETEFGSYFAARSGDIVLILEGQRSEGDQFRVELSEAIYVKAPQSSLTEDAYIGSWRGVRIESIFSAENQELFDFQFEEYSLEIKSDFTADYAVNFSSSGDSTGESQTVAWQLVDGRFQVPGVFEPYVSASGDLMITGSYSQGSGSENPDSLDLEAVIKLPDSLEDSEVIGLWAVAELEANLTVSLSGPEDVSISADRFYIDIHEDHTFSLTSAGNLQLILQGGSINPVEYGTWSIQGVELVLDFGNDDIASIKVDEGADVGFFSSFEQESLIRYSGEVLLGVHLGSNLYPALEYFGDTDYYGQGWSFSAWYGWILDNNWPWVYHNEHGWIYLSGESSQPGMWVYDLTLGWTYTSSQYYPFVYSTEDGWLWFQRGSRRDGTSRWFYIFDQEMWSQVDLP